MRKPVLALLVSCGLLLSGCLAGPHQLSRTADDWDNQLYVDSAVLNGLLWIIPVIPIIKAGAFAGDFLITDAYAFWLNDLFGSGEGTAFRHRAVESSKTMTSLLSDGTFLKIETEE